MNRLPGAILLGVALLASDATSSLVGYFGSSPSPMNRAIVARARE